MCAQKTKITPRALQELKAKGERAVLLTAYDVNIAKIEDELGIDIILVGDSAGMVMLGYENTLQVTMDEMLVFTRAVARAAKRAMIIADMPFMSYQPSREIATKNAGEFIRAGADGVKLEGGEHICHIIEYLVKIGIPVMGHIGMTPQSIKQLSGYRVCGRTQEERKKLVQDAIALEEAGVFSIIVECVLPDVTREIHERLHIPVYGIGSGPHCDGQILVVQDILGIYQGKLPRYVKKYANLSNEIRNAIKNYIEDVKNGKYPSPEYWYT